MASSINVVTVGYLGSNLLIAAMATAVCAVVCLVAMTVGVVLHLVALVVIGVLIWRQWHRKRGQYKFHQIPFSDADEEEMWEQLKLTRR